MTFTDHVDLKRDSIKTRNQLSYSEYTVGGSQNSVSWTCESSCHGSKILIYSVWKNQGNPMGKYLLHCSLTRFITHMKVKF